MTTLSAIPLPADVVEYVGDVFASADAAVCARLARQPNAHEEFLDLSLVDAVAMYSGPHRTQSDTVVDIDIHFVGGGWHYERWEVADIGLIVRFRYMGQTLRTKIVLLQSKRLYPRESDFVETHGLARPGGFGYLARMQSEEIHHPRLFTFDADCRYKALQVGDNQWAVIGNYEARFGIPVYYLLYHPEALPTAVSVPISLPYTGPTTGEVGSRVLPAALLRAAATRFPRNYAPSIQDLASPDVAPGTRLSRFITDQVLACTEGYVSDDFLNDPGIDAVFNRRSAPIAAAILVDIDLPETANPSAPFGRESQIVLDPELDF